MNTNRLTQYYEPTLTKRENGQLVLILTPFCGDAIILEETMNKELSFHARAMLEMGKMEDAPEPKRPPADEAGAERVTDEAKNTIQWIMDFAKDTTYQNAPQTLGIIINVCREYLDTH